MDINRGLLHAAEIQALIGVDIEDHSVRQVRSMAITAPDIARSSRSGADYPWADQMTPARFTECLEHLHWSTETLAGILGCDESLTEAYSLAVERMEDENSHGFMQCHAATSSSATVIGRAIAADRLSRKKPA